MVGFQFKKFFLFNLIGALVISALVAVITILIGEFNETSAKVKIHADDVIPILFMDNMGITYFFKDCSRHRN